jgi:glyoxylase-like metal-dependent hydrolase (beta-lactamase superfamily II)
MTTIRRFQAGLFPVNAYTLETPHGVVVVDSTLGVSDGRALRAAADALGKPLLAVLVTHAHPDHYGGLASLLEGRDTPVYAAAGVGAVIRRDDEIKERILRPMFGDEWAHTRRFPDRVVADGERLTFDGATFRLVDLGPGESPHDSLWLLEGADGAAEHAFVGDLVYDHMHCFLADGEYKSWRANIARARRILSPRTTLHMGHGTPGEAAALLDWQEGYLAAFVDAVERAERAGLATEAFAAAVTADVQRYLPGADLLFLMQLSIEPMRAVLAADRKT